MKNNKGFTLIELLAVVVILLSISVIAIVNISKSLHNRKTKDFEDDKEMLIEYAQIYISNSDMSNNNNLYNCIKNSGFLKLDDLAKLKKMEIKSGDNHGYMIYDSSKNEIVWASTIDKNAKDCKTKV